MGMADSYFVLMGILRYCPETIPADTQAIQRALSKLSKWHPRILPESLFDEDGFSQKLEDDLEIMMMKHSLGLCGEKLETLKISDDFRSNYDRKVAGAFTKAETMVLRKMGESFPKLLRKNESVRYRNLTAR